MLLHALLAATAILDILQVVVVADGTPIPIDLYTDIACATPSTQNANVSLPLQVCAVTPGLGSALLNPFPCTTGNVRLYAYTDIICGSQDDNVYRLTDHCIGPATANTYAAIMLSCNQDEPGNPTGTTTIAVGVVATAGPAATSSESPATAATGSATTGTGTTGTETTISPTTAASPTPTETNSDSSSGWDSFSTGGKVGTIVGGGGGGLIAIGIVAIVAKTLLKAHKQHLDAKRHHHPETQQSGGGYGDGGGGGGYGGGLPAYNGLANTGGGGSDNGSL